MGAPLVVQLLRRAEDLDAIANAIAEE